MSGFFFPKDELNETVQNDTFDYATSGWSDVLRNSFDQAIKRNMPSTALMRWNELQEKQDYIKPGDDGTIETLRGIGYDDNYLNKLKQRKVLSKQEANEQYGIEKVLTFDHDITEEAAQIIRRRKDEELIFNEISERTKGITKNVAGFLAETAVSMLDPVNLAANFVPIVSSARYAAFLAKYGKTGARLFKGALEGFGGQALVEPIIFSTLWYEKADYDMYDSMVSLLGGAVGGAGLHELFGAVGDTVRGYRLSTAQRAIKAGVAQNINGRKVNVEHIFDMDENVKTSNIFDSPLIDDKPEVQSPLDIKLDEVEAKIKYQDEVEQMKQKKYQDEVEKLKEMAKTPEEKDKELYKELVELEKAVEDTVNESLPWHKSLNYTEIIQDMQAKGVITNDIAKVLAESPILIKTDIDFWDEKFKKYIDILKKEKEVIDEQAHETWNLQHPPKQDISSIPEEPSKDLGFQKDIIEPNVKTEIDGSTLTKVGDQLGSNPGGTYIDKGGQKWYVKFLPDQVHIRNELLANLLYRLSGINVPELRLTEIDGKVGLASRWVEGAKELHPVHLTEEAFNNLTIEQKRQLWTGFVVDAWLANWDAVSSKNIVVLPDGNIMRIDQGGSLMYRAMGEQKGKQFKHHVEEIYSMKSHANSPEGGIIHGEIPKEMLDEGAARVLGISHADIDEALDASGISGKLKQTLMEKLVARQHDIEQKFPKLAESLHYKAKKGMQTLFTEGSAVKKINEVIEKVKQLYSVAQNKAMSDYVSSSYSLNHYLWLTEEAKKLYDANNIVEAANIHKVIKHLDTAIKKYKFETPTQVWRGVVLYDAPFINPETNTSFKISVTNYQDAVGSVVRHRGYTTASLMKSSAVTNHDLIYRLDVPEGYNVAFPNVATESFKRSENQVILPRDTVFKITRAIIDPESDHRIIVYGKVEPQTGTITKKKKTPKTVKQHIDDSIVTAKDTASSAADPEPLSPAVKDPGELIKEVSKPINTVEDAMASVKAKELVNQIVELENDVKLYNTFKETEAKGLTSNEAVHDPEHVAYMKSLDDDIAMANAQIETAKSKLEALQTAFECVTKNL